MSSVPDAMDIPVDSASQWTHRAKMEMRREKTRQLAISLETKRVDQNMELMKMRMQLHGQNPRKHVSPGVRHKGLSNSSIYASSQASSSLSHPYGPSPASSSTSSRRRRSSASIASHLYHSNSSIASHSEHSNSSLSSLHFDGLIVEPSGNPVDVAASGGRGYSSGDPASSVYADGKGVETWALENALDNNKTSNTLDRSHLDRHEFTNAVDGYGDVLSGSVSGTNGPIHTTDVHTRTMHGGAVHASDGRVHDGRAYATSGSAEVTNGSVYPTDGDMQDPWDHPTEDDVYIARGSANATNGHINDGRVAVTGGDVNDAPVPAADGSVNDGRVPSAYGLVNAANATNAHVHYMTGGYDDGTSGHHPEELISDRRDYTIDDNDAAIPWMYENADGTAVDANSVCAAGAGFSATNGV